MPGSVKATCRYRGGRRQSAVPSRMMLRPGARHAFELRNDLAEIDRLAAELEDFGARHDLPPATIFAVNLALEEVVSNVIAHGYDDAAAHRIGVELRALGDAVEVAVEDDGRPFNPLTAAAPDVEVSLDERDVGGLGVLLVRKLMDDVTYERVADRNVLTFKKQMEPRESPADG